MIGLALSFNFFMAENFAASIGSFVVALFFIFLMIRNIRAVKKIKEEKRRNDN